MKRKDKKMNKALKVCPFCGCGGVDDDSVEFHIASDGVVWGIISCDDCGAQIKETADDNGDLIYAYPFDGGWIVSPSQLDKVRKACIAAWEQRSDNANPKEFQAKGGAE